MDLYDLYWTNEAVANLENIIAYLEENWSEKEVAKFKNGLSKLLNIICRYSFIFPQSEHQKRLRKAVLSKQISVFYEVRGKSIFLAYIFSNAQDISRIQ